MDWCARRRSPARRPARFGEAVEELLPWQLRGKQGPRRVQKTFMFTDIEGSTNLVEALGDEAWHGVLRWHDETLRSLSSPSTRERRSWDGRRILRWGRFARRSAGLRGRDPAAPVRPPSSNGFALEVRMASTPRVRPRWAGTSRVGGVHEAARIAALANGDGVPCPEGQRRPTGGSPSRSLARSP